MAAFMRRERFERLALLFVGVAFVITTVGCSDDARARRSFKRVVYKEIKQFNKYHQREVRPHVYESDGRFYRVYHERVDSVVNMRRTNSLDTPYIATLSFTENVYLTRRRPSRQDSKRDGHFILSSSSRREMIYAFVHGLWRKKEEY
ncbi:MAG: hypothetical protein JSV16_14725 [Candidatus Hydrogenedentota bacterium]|nr:MAG: hypothetical protein JSV16_14725 [Candidatus Hydrogenedentota bacterium]